MDLNEDLKRADGKKYGIVGGKNPDGPNHPAAQAAAGAVMVSAVVLSAKAGAFAKKLKSALAKKAPLLLGKLEKVGAEVAEEIAKKLGKKLQKDLGKNAEAHVRTALAETLKQNGAIGPFNVMKQFTDKLGGAYQAHHILERSMAKKFGLGNADEIPSVILNSAQHKTVTAALAAETAKAKTTQQLWKAYQKVYQGYPPHWLDAIKSYFVKGP